MFIKIVRGFQTAIEIIQTVRSSKIANNTLDIVHFALGFVGLRNLIKMYGFQDREIKKLYDDLPLWQQRTWKIADFLGNLSLILGALKSQITITVSKRVIQKVLSSDQIERFFGAQSHMPSKQVYQVVSILSFLMAVPATLKTFFSIYSRLNHLPPKSLEEQDENFYTPVMPKKIDIMITLKTVSETAREIIRSPHK
jgi:hypothetical protein